MRQAFVLVFLAVIGVFSASGRREPSDVAGYARQLQSRVGAKVGIGRVSAIEAEGDTLVVTFDGPENWRMGQLSYVLTQPFLEGFSRPGGPSLFSTTAARSASTPPRPAAAGSRASR